jgi:hypothetical protein
LNATAPRLFRCQQKMRWNVMFHVGAFTLHRRRAIVPPAVA